MHTSSSWHGPGTPLPLFTCSPRPPLLLFTDTSTCAAPVINRYFFVLQCDAFHLQFARRLAREHACTSIWCHPCHTRGTLPQRLHQHNLLSTTFVRPCLCQAVLVPRRPSCPTPSVLFAFRPPMLRSILCSHPFPIVFIFAHISGSSTVGGSSTGSMKAGTGLTRRSGKWHETVLVAVPGTCFCCFAP